jgi:plasmid stability protein
MAQIIVRNLDDGVRDRLRQRASRKGRSMEEEVRDILAAAVAAEETLPTPLGTRISQRFAGLGLEEELPELRGPARPASFDP